MPEVDRDYLIEVCSRLCRVDTSVPLGHRTLMEPDDPKLVRYVQEAIRPELVTLGVRGLIVAGNNLVVSLGPADGPAILIQSYCVSQHHNLMQDPWSGRVEDGRVFGQGVSQCKAHQAVLLAVVKMLIDARVGLGGRLYWSVNCEGRSSHGCTNAILAALDPKPDFCIVQYPTGVQRVSVGNRGRVDVNVHIEGKLAHSSTPHLGLSAIDGANEVINRLRTLHWPDTHPVLGGRQAVVYKIEYAPLAPHTLPSDAYLTVDRRLLPGDDPAAATQEIRDVIGDLSPYRMTIEPGVCMLPSLVDAEQPVVQRFTQGLESYCHGGTYDAGGTAAAGIPTVMFGAAGGAGLAGEDFVTIDDMETEAGVLARFILAELAC